MIGSAGGMPSAIGSHDFAARAGHHLTPRQLSSGRNVFEDLGTGFTLIDLGADAAAVSDFRDAAEAKGIPLTIISDDTAENRDFYKTNLMLVRPDQFVAWAGDSAMVNARKILGCAVGDDP